MVIIALGRTWREGIGFGKEGWDVKGREGREWTRNIRICGEGRDRDGEGRDGEGLGGR